MRIVKPILYAAVGLFAAGVLGTYIYREEHRPAVLQVYVFSLKSGRAMFIRTPEDRRMLVDGGGNGDIVEQLSGILPFYSRRIDALVATHPESKSVGGLIDVLGRYKVDRIYIPAVATSTDEVYDTFESEVTHNGLIAEPRKAGDTIPLDPRITFKIIFPAPADAFAYSRASSPELLFKLTFGKTSLTVMGNATPKIQKFIASSSDVRKTDVLIVSHSALPSTMSKNLLDIARPEYLIYSQTVTVASNRSAAHSAQEVPIPHKINLTEKGTVKITSDGAHILVE